MIASQRLAVAVAVAMMSVSSAAQAAVAVIPDVGRFTSYGSGDASVTYDGVVFSQSALIDPTATLFNVSPGFSGAPVPVLSSQDSTSLTTANILITLPYAVRAVSFGYGTFDGGTVNFALSNGALFSLSSSNNGYILGSTFAAATATPFTSVLLTYTDVDSFPVLNIGDVTYGPTAGSVPEPATWAMMLVGFGMVGFGLRASRRGKVATKVAYA